MSSVERLLHSKRARLERLTATPAKHTYGFFNQNVVMEYPHAQAVADGVDVLTHSIGSTRTNFLDVVQVEERPWRRRTGIAGGVQVGAIGVAWVDAARFELGGTAQQHGIEAAPQQGVGVALIDRAGRRALVRSTFDLAADFAHLADHDVLHWTIRHLLGEHARQAGSLVAPGRLRFDFTHFEAPSRDLLEEVQGTANRRLGEDAAGEVRLRARQRRGERADDCEKETTSHRDPPPRL